MVAQAQQRYRERRKAKFAEMEQALAVLHAQVEQLQGVQSHNAHLQASLWSRGMSV